MHRKFTRTGQNTAPLAREVNPHLRRWRLTQRVTPIFTQRISPSLRSDLLVVMDAVAPPGTVIVVHHVCDQLPTACLYPLLHYELHGYEHFATLPTLDGNTRRHPQYR
jgi:hypothetical protein